MVAIQNIGLAASAGLRALNMTTSTGGNSTSVSASTKSSTPGIGWVTLTKAVPPVVTTIFPTNKSTIITSPVILKTILSGVTTITAGAPKATPVSSAIKHETPHVAPVISQSLSNSHTVTVTRDCTRFITAPPHPVSTGNHIAARVANSTAGTPDIVTVTVLQNGCPVDILNTGLSGSKNSVEQCTVLRYIDDEGRLLAAPLGPGLKGIGQTKTVINVVTSTVESGRCRSAATEKAMVPKPHATVSSAPASVTASPPAAPEAGKRSHVRGHIDAVTATFPPYVEHKPQGGNIPAVYMTY